jgi:general secretion pathway protein G
MVIQGGVGRKDRKGREGGFTLLELLVVLAILGLIAIIATPRVLHHLSGAKSKTAAIQVQQLSGALDFYRLGVGRYPSQTEGMTALVERPDGAEGWDGPYVGKKEMMVDPWGEPFRYRIPGRHGAYDLYSLGADKREGGDGEDRDIVSW